MYIDLSVSKRIVSPILDSIALTFGKVSFFEVSGLAHLLMHHQLNNYSAVQFFFIQAL